MNDTEMQAAHAALYKRATDMMAVQAGMMRNLSGPVQLDAVDVAGVFASTAANVLVTEMGHAAAVSFLRSLADTIEAGAPLAN